MAQPGDTILVAAGVYRERVKPPRGGTAESPITYKAKAGEKVVITGLDLWNPTWVPDTGNVFSAIPDEALFQDDQYVDGGNPYRIATVETSNMVGRNHTHTLSLGHVVVDGVMWEEMGRKEDMRTRIRSWWCDLNTGRIYMHFPGNNPSAHQVEITTRRGVFRPHLRGLGHIVVDGFIMEYCANQFPHQFWSTDATHQSGLIGTRAGHHWTIRNCLFRRAKSIAMSVGRGGTASGVDNEVPKQLPPPIAQIGFHLIENNVFEFNGSGGIQGLGHNGVVVSNNYFRNNNYLQHQSHETGCIKFHLTNDAVVEGNRFEKNNCVAVWYDNTVRRSRISGNLIHGSRGPGISGDGIFLEMLEEGAGNEIIVDNNVIIGVQRHGIYTHDASHSIITNNLIMDSGRGGLHFRDQSNTRKGNCHNHWIHNNLILRNQSPIQLPVDWGDSAYNNQSDFNVFWPASERFAVTTHGDAGGNRNHMMAAILDAWENAGSIPPDLNGLEWETPGSILGYWTNLAQWRAIRENDLNSVYADIHRLHYDPNTFTLTIETDQAPLLAGAPSVPEVNSDYWGNPIGEYAKAGPFQNLAAGLNILQLWPDYENAIPESNPEDTLTAWRVTGETVASTVPFGLERRADYLGVTLKDGTGYVTGIERPLSISAGAPLFIQFDYFHTDSALNSGLQLSNGSQRGINLHMAGASGAPALNEAGSWTTLNAVLQPDTWYRFTLLIHPLVSAIHTFDLQVQSLDPAVSLHKVFPSLRFQTEVESLNTLKFHFNLPAGTDGGEYHLGNLVVSGYRSGLESPFKTWLAAYRDVGERDPDTGRLLDDADGDGVPNLYKYVFGGEIGIHNRNPASEKVEYVWENGSFILSRRTISIEDTEQVLGYSLDLQTWTDVSLTPPLSPGVSLGADVNGMQEISVTADPALTGDDNRIFWRLQVSEVFE